MPEVSSQGHRGGLSRKLGGPSAPTLLPAPEGEKDLQQSCIWLICSVPWAEPLTEPIFLVGQR